MKLVPALVIAALAISTLSDAQPSNGFWCWVRPDGDLGLCGRERVACEAVRDGYNRTAIDLGIAVILQPCTWQQAAWERYPQRVESPALHHFPTRELCVRGLDKGASCREVR